MQNCTERVDEPKGSHEYGKSTAIFARDLSLSSGFDFNRDIRSTQRN